MNFEDKTYDELMILHDNFLKQLRAVNKVLVIKRSSKYIKEHTMTCEICNVTTNKYNYDKHLTTKSHINKVKGLTCEYKCEVCNITTNKTAYEKHIKTKKHLKNMENKNNI